MLFGRAANDIEHGVLRGNAASPASPFVLVGLPQLAGKTFRKGDPRLAQVEPRPGQLSMWTRRPCLLPQHGDLWEAGAVAPCVLIGHVGTTG